MTTIEKIKCGKWSQDDWCIVFPKDAGSNMMIRRWATLKIGQVITDAKLIEAERRKAVYKEHGFELNGLEGDQMDMANIKLGLEGREKDVE